MNYFDIISIGTATVDVVAKLAANEPRSKRFLSGEQCFPLGAKQEMDDFCVVSGGGATNTAVTFSRQGFKTAAVFEVGTDVLGEFVIRGLQSERVTVFPSRNRKLPTAGSVILVGKNGERTVLTHRGAANDLSLKEIPLNQLKAQWLYLVPGGMSYSTVAKLIQHAKRNGIKVAFNPSAYFIHQGRKKTVPVLREIDMLLVNQDEALEIAGLSRNRGPAVFRRLNKLVKGILVVTNSSKGVLVSDSRRVWLAGIFKNKKVVDRLGAGDAFGSGFVSGLMRMNELCAKEVCNPKAIEYAIRLGSANATSVVEALGAKAGILTAKEFGASKRWQNLKIIVKQI